MLYGTGAIRVDANNDVIACGSAASKYTIKDGIVYDAAKLRADVRAIVAAAKDEAGRPELVQPGLPGDVPNLEADAATGDP